MAALRVFSYLPNPRIWKATIAARLVGVEVEVRGAAPGELKDWLWDFDAHPLSEADKARGALERTPRAGFRDPLFKTDAFLDAHPFGTVPAAFSPDGATGVFESNSIMRAVARLGGTGSTLYGQGPYEASRIDSFLDAALVFGRDAQLYLFSLTDRSAPVDLHARAASAFAAYVGGVDRALSPGRSFIVGEHLTLADICFVAELCLFSNERRHGALIAERGLSPVLSQLADFPRPMAHFERLCAHPAFAPDVAPYMAKLSASAA